MPLGPNLIYAMVDRLVSISSLKLSLGKLIDFSTSIWEASTLKTNLYFIICGIFGCNQKPLVSRIYNLNFIL